MPDRPIVAVLLNPRSSRGKGDDDCPRIAAALEDHCDLRITVLQEHDDIAALTRAAIDDGASIVVAGGGDGTVSAVAAALVGTDVALGIVPLGTSNSIADGLGLPTDLESACRVIALGHRRAVDTARIGESFMMLMATIGLHARAITEASPEAKARLGVIAYVGKAFDVLLEQDPFVVELEFPEGPTVKLTAHAVTVANLCPPRSVLAQGPPAVVPDDGLLDVTVVAFSGALNAVATSFVLFTSALRGLPADREGVAYARVSRLTINAEPLQPLMIDGEQAGTTPFTVECLPRSLQVIVAQS